MPKRSEGVHDQTAVVGKDRRMDDVVQAPGLDERVLDEALSILHRVECDAFVLRKDDMDPVEDETLHLISLVGVA